MINLQTSRSKIPEELKLLRKTYPNAKTALNFKTPIQMLVSTILSAQCTDVRVNMVTPALFDRYKNVEDFAEANLSELTSMISSINFYKNKAKNILAAAKMIVEKFDGKLPRTLDEMIELPGIGRKTANVVLHNVYNIVEGVVVDTHVRRLSRRLGWTKEESPEKVEQDLMKVLPRPDWDDISYLLIDHGRAICKAPKPLCAECVLQKICPSAFSFDAKGKWVGVK